MLPPPAKSLPCLKEKQHFEETSLESIRHAQSYKVSDTSIFSASQSQGDLFAFWFYLVAPKNMTQFGRVTCQQGKRRRRRLGINVRVYSGTFVWRCVCVSSAE